MCNRNRNRIAAAPAVGGPSQCPLEITLDLIWDRTKILIAWHLFWGPRLFGDLTQRCPHVPLRRLRRALVEMEVDGLVRKQVPAQAPRARRRVAFELTAAGQTLRPSVAALYEWGLHRRPRPLPAPAATRGSVPRLRLVPT